MLTGRFVFGNTGRTGERPARGKRKKGGLIFLLILLYLICGAVFPFLHYKEIRQGTPLRPELAAMAAGESEPGIDRAMLLETNQSAWEERIRLMSRAKERIILSTFDMRDGESTRDLLALILQKADEGVKVQILVDGFSGTVRMKGRSLFYAISSHPNIEIRHYNPLNPLVPWKTQGRMHDKYVIADDLGYILGGRNTFDYFIGEYDSQVKGYDREVLVYNSAHGAEDGAKSSLHQVENYFQEVWNLEVTEPFADKTALEEKKAVQAMRRDLKARLLKLENTRPDLFEEPDYAKRTFSTDSICLLSNSTGIYAKEPEVFYQLTGLMEAAGEPAVIHTPYLVCNSYMGERLSQVKNSVPDLKIVFNSIENGDNFFASSDYLRRKKDLVKLEIPLYEYDGGHSAHGKSVVIGDRICAVGSYNFDLRSTYVDTELMLVIESRGLAGELRSNMEVLEKDCRKVVSETEYETPAHVRVRKVPPIKMAAMKLVGILMQPFRFLI